MARGTLLVAALLASGCLGVPTMVPTGEETVPARGGFSDTAVYPGSYRQAWPWGPLHEGPFRELVQEVRDVPSKLDGANIQIAVLRPKLPDTQRVPVILHATPYVTDFRGLNLPEGQGLDVQLARHGFAYVYVALRGYGASGGCPDLVGPKEAHDIDQAITWAATQPWSTGSVGMEGFSFGGITQWEAASLANPHLKAIVPAGATPRPFAFANGTGPLDGGLVGVTTYGPALSLLLNELGWFTWSRRAPPPPAPTTLAQRACPALADLVIASADGAVTHQPDARGFWAARDRRATIEEKYRGSALVYHRFQDEIVSFRASADWLPRLEDTGVPMKRILAQGGHWVPEDGGPHDARHDWAEIVLRWFDYWLRDNATQDLGQRIQVEDSQGRWRSADSWPPRVANTTTYYLSTSGLQAAATGARSTVPVTPRVDVATPEVAWYAPRVHLTDYCAQCPRFVTPPLAEALRFAGQPEFHVTVVPTAPGGTMVAYLFDAPPVGEWRRLGHAVMDFRFAEGGETSKPVTPNQPLLLRAQFGPLDAAVAKGHRLLLLVSGGRHYGADPQWMESPFHLQVGADTSQLRLRTFTVPDEAFFDPPP